MSPRTDSKHKKTRTRWIVKAGSQMVCAGGPILIRAWMRQVSELAKSYNIEVIWVTSGAIASASDRLEFKKKKRKLADKQALSAIGQPMVMDLYNLSLASVGLMGAQVLLTAQDMDSKKGSHNLRNTLSKLLEWKMVPVLNENDAVATEEIQFGDNDSLSSKVAVLMQADRLVLLTDVDGLYSDNPKTNPKAKLIPELETVPASLLRLTSRSKLSARGKGGMYSKLLAAQRASRAHIVTHLVRGDSPNVLINIAEHRNPGTIIGPIRG